VIPALYDPFDMPRARGPRCSHCRREVAPPSPRRTIGDVVEALCADCVPQGVPGSRRVMRGLRVKSGRQANRHAIAFYTRQSAQTGRAA
jgi:hypothetical protein